MSQTFTPVLTIAASDGCGGAGIQADLKTFAAFRCYGLSAVTAVTAQNTRGITEIHSLPPRVLEKQLQALAEDFQFTAIKIGMIYSRENIEVVAEFIQSYASRWVVLDPIFQSSSGTPLLEEDARELFKEVLLPLANVITPNWPEAENLFKVTNFRELMRMLPGLPYHIFLTGGHLQEPFVADVLLQLPESLHEFRHERLQTTNTHGTGCTLSSALTACLALGMPLLDAARAASEYTYGALKAARNLRLGRGNGPLHHFYKDW
ncbi:MAG: bifunctional hydroxymethylpyrimidine kinase/phosphomethylpyrimidine kinase [Calditrichia bacterium]